MRTFTGEPFGIGERPDLIAGEQAARAAQSRLHDLINVTPLIQSRSLNALAGRSLWFKAENLQRTGSYKPRGSFNSLLVARERGEITAGGVVVDSSGNFGQAIAFGARELQVEATVFMPADSNEMKARACAAAGATVVREGITWQNRGSSARDYAEEHDLLYLPADAWEGMAGDGTLSLELLDQNHDFDTVVAPLSSGGLLAGMAIVLKSLRPDIRVVGVQPAASGHALRSLQSGRICTLDEAPRTIADGARTLALGERPFAILQSCLDSVVLVDDEWTLRATWLLMTRTKMVVEPTGALAFAAVLAGKVASDRVVCLISGGNADLADLGTRFRAAGFVASDGAGN